MKDLDKILAASRVPDFESSITKMMQTNAILGIGNQSSSIHKMIEASNPASLFAKQSGVLNSILNVRDFTQSYSINKGALDYILNNPSMVEAQKQNSLMKAVLGGGSTLNYLTGVDLAKKRNGIMDVVLGGSTLNYITKISQAEHRQKDVYKALTVLGGIQSAVTKHIDTYNNQLKLSEQLAKTFSAFVPPKSPMYAAFTSENFVEHKKLNTFDVISGASFFNTLAKYDEDDDRINELYAKTQTVLASNVALQEEVMKLNATLIAMQNGNGRMVETEKYYKIKGVKDYAEWFMNKILIRKFRIDPQTAIIIMTIVFMVASLTYEIYIEAKGGDIYNHTIGNEEQTKIDTVTIIKYVQQPNEVTDFTIDKTPVYLASSTKTKRIGSIAPNTTLSIIKIKNGWCLVEVLATVTKPDTRKNRKKYKTEKSPIEIQKTVRGWVEKRHLDMFQ